MDPGRAAARLLEVNSTVILGFSGSQGGVEGDPLSELCSDVAPSGADAVAVSGIEPPASINSAPARAVTSSGAPIQVPLIWFAPVLNHRLAFDSLHH